MKKRKTVDELFEEVKDYDLVLTVDAPLADALNARIKTARLTNFAETPRRYAYGQQIEEVDVKKDMFLKIVHEEDISWKQASFLMDNVIESWQATEDIDTILETEEFDTEACRKIVDILKEANSPFNALEDTEISEDVDLAVVNLYQFNDLDKKVLPENYDTFNLLRDEDIGLEEFKIFSSASGIVKALKQNVTEENADQVGLVVDPESQYQPLIEAGLRAEGVPFHYSRGYSEDEDLRTFVQLARLSVGSDRVLLRDIQPVLRHFDLYASEKKNNAVFSDIEDEEVQDLADFMNTASFMQVEDFVKGYEELLGQDVENLREIISDLNLEEEALNEQTLSRLEYYLNSFDPSVGSSDDGVLMASPGSTVCVDRPIVYYIGMDADWTHEVVDRPWINREAEEERNLKDFQALVQNGRERYYMVQDREFNEEVTPCLYLNHLTGIESFTDAEHERFQLGQESQVKGFTKLSTNIETKKVETLSQASLNIFVENPRAYYFSSLVSDVEKEAFVKGNLFHDFAEFYANFPEMVDERGDEVFVEIMKEEIRPYVDEIELEGLDTEFELGLKNIKQFLRQRDIPREESEKSEESGRYDNVFAEHFDKDLVMEIAELWFEDNELGAKGKIDLALGTEIVDYKSSSRTRSPSNVVKNSNVDLFDERPDFQPLMYLCYLRKSSGDKKLDFTYFYFMSDVGGDINGDSELEDKVTAVSYYPDNFDSIVSERSTFEMLIKGVAKSNDRRKTLEKLGYSKFSQFFSENSIPHPYSKDKLVESEFASEFISFAKNTVGDYKYVEKGCKKSLRKLVDFRTCNYFEEDLDKFEEFLDDKLDEINECKESRFPVDGKSGRTGFEDMMIE